MGKRKEEQAQVQEDKGFVVINSEVTVRVFPGIFYENASNNDTRIGDRLKVIEKWSKYGILIKQGANTVAADIAEWPTVQGLIAHKKMYVVGRQAETDKPEALKSKEIAEEAKAEEASLEKLAEE